MMARKEVRAGTPGWEGRDASEACWREAPGVLGAVAEEEGEGEEETA